MNTMTLVAVAGLAAAALVVTSPYAQAAGDSIAGRTVMVKCQGCHGKDGNHGAPNAPNLAGQKQDYLYWSLMDFKIGARKNRMMLTAVKDLSDEDMANVAAYYAAIKIIVEVPQ